MRYAALIISSLLLINSNSVYSQLQDLSLSKAIALALENNYGLSISRSEFEIAEINNNWGNAGRYPTIAFNAASNNSYDLADNSMTNRINAGIGLDWILFDGFSVNISKTILENTEDLTAGRLSVIVENTIEDVILGYYGVLLQEERLHVLKTIVDLSHDRYDYELERKSLGSAVTYEVLQAENVYLNDKADYLDQEMQVRNAKRNFNFILAEKAEIGWEFTEAFEGDTVRFQLSDLQDKMLSNNQTLKNQYTNLLLKQNDINLKESAFYPSISTSVGMDNNVTFNRVNGAGSTISGYAPYANIRLSYDIYKGGVRKRSLEVAKINEENAQVEIEQMEHALTNELLNLYDYYDVRISLLNVAEKSLDAAELNLKISEEKYKSGVINSFNYRDIQLMYIEASLRKLQAIYNLITSKTQLTRITGGFLKMGE